MTFVFDNKADINTVKFVVSHSKQLLVFGFENEKDAIESVDDLNAQHSQFYKDENGNWETTDAECPAYIVSLEEFKEILVENESIA